VEAMNESITSEVEARLEALFGDMEEQPAAREEDPQPQDDPLRKLKAAVLSLEWEITDEVISALMSELDGLKRTLEGDQTAQVFLQLLIALGSYVRAKRGKAHPHTLDALSEVFSNFEEALSSETTAAAKRKLLHKSIERFKQLKQEIALKKTEPVKKVENKDAPAKEETPQASLNKPKWEISKESWEELMQSNQSVALSVEALVRNMEEITEVFRSQYDALREEMHAAEAAPERCRKKRASGRVPKYSISKAAKRNRRG
jgi:hypothetical protein